MDEIALRRSIPDSVLPYPKGINNRSKYVFWRLITPFHNHGRDFLLNVGVLHHESRHNYTLGTLAPGRDVAEFLKYLESRGWGNNFIAWREEGEIIGIRKIESFERQYHIRIFRDGEVCGHYEYTPECRPRWHLKEIGIEERREEFMKELGDWVIPSSFPPLRSEVTPSYSVSSPMGVGAEN